MKRDYGFCSVGGQIAQKIYNLIACDILGKEQKDKIITRYNDMRYNFNNYPKDYVKGGRKEWVFSEGLSPFKPEGRKTFYTDTTAVPMPITHPEFIDLTVRTECQGKGAIGLDLPTWFCQTGNEPFIMIVAQDPLRSCKWYGECNDAVVSTPFGLQDANHRERGNGGLRIWTLVQQLLSMGYGVYLTDCRKYFVHNHQKSNEYSKAKIGVYKKILKEEIEIIRPLLIVTLGHEATDYCQMILDNDNRLSGYIPHLSGTANGVINKFIAKNFGINPKGAKQQAEYYAKYIDNKVRDLR